MNIALILPDNPGWKSDARASNFTVALTALGHKHDIFFMKKDAYPKNLTAYDIVFNHALQSPPLVLRRLAESHPSINVVHVNHSAIGHIEASGDRLINRLCDTIHASRALRNVWTASVEKPSFQSSANVRQLHLPIPLQSIASRERSLPAKKPVVVMAGRVDPVKNQINQLLACCNLKAKIDLRLCLDPPPWMTNVLHACGMQAKCHGMLEHRKWIEFLREEADILLQCGFTESFNITACEAMQIGIPVIANQSIWFTDSELHANPNDVSQIQERVELAIEDYESFSSRSATRGHETSRWTREKYADAIATIKEHGGCFYPRKLPKIGVPGSGEKAIAVVCGSKETDRILEKTRPRMKAYAASIGANFVEIAAQPLDGYKVGNKWIASQVAEQYERVLLLDCDIWIADDAPDIFQSVPPGLIAAVDETEVYGTQKAAEVLARYAATQGVKAASRMLNGGVILFDGKLASLYRQPQRKCHYMHILDQVALSTEVASRSESLHPLDPKFNWVFARRDFWVYASSAYFVHLAGANPLQYRLDLLDRFDQGDFSILEPPSLSRVAFAKHWIRGSF